MLLTALKMLGLIATVLGLSYVDMVLPVVGVQVAAVLMVVALWRWTYGLFAQLLSLLLVPLFTLPGEGRFVAVCVWVFLSCALRFGDDDGQDGLTGGGGGQARMFAPYEAELRQLLWNNVPHGWRGIGVVDALMRRCQQDPSHAPGILRRVERFTPTPVKRMTREEIEERTERRIQRRLQGTSFT